MKSLDEQLQNLRRQRRRGEEIRAAVNKSANAYYRRMLEESIKRRPLMLDGVVVKKSSESS